MDAFWILDHLDKKVQPPLSCIAEVFAFFATPIGKQLLGIEGWDDTGYVADGRGIVQRDAQWSTDLIYTVDVELIFLRILKLVRHGPGIFLRLEITPWVPAHATCSSNHGIKKDRRIAFQGPVLLDHDGSWIEVHPTHIWLLP